jgi:hypothetical protein
MLSAVNAANNPAEAAGLSQPAFTYFVPAGAVAIVCLTLSEILSLLLQRRTQETLR